MHPKIFIIALVALSVTGCNNSSVPDLHADEDNPRFQYTAYSNDFELFAEADPFVAGDTANVLSHFSWLSDFKPLDSGRIKIILQVNGNETSQLLAAPLRKGIFSFDIRPEIAGKGLLKFELETEKGMFEIFIPEVTVFATVEEAHDAAENYEVSSTNASVFTKEQSWKIDFCTEIPVIGPFGQVIRTTALLQPSPAGEVILTAKADGKVSLPNSTLLEGKEVSAGQILMTISGAALAENNSSVRYSEARNNYEKAKTDFDRARDLSNDKIVSEKELAEVKNRFENARATFENLDANFNASGQNVTSPMSGYVKQVFVNNGTFVEAGKPLLSVSQNKTLILTADVPQKYAGLLDKIASVNIHSIQDEKTYSLEQLNGKLLSYGRSANNSNYLIPVNFQIENNGSFTPGSFVEIWLKTLTNREVVSVPNTSLLEEHGVFFVYVQLTPELFEKREVKPGVTDGISTEIIEGISEKERVVTKGPVFIRLSQSTGTLDAHSGHVH